MDKVFLLGDEVFIVSPLAGETGPKMKSRDREGGIAAIYPPLCPMGLQPLGLSLPQGERRHRKEKRIGQVILNSSLILSFSFLLNLGFLSLSSCASDAPSAPCPHFGLYCSKTPINSWTSEGNNNA